MDIHIREALLGDYDDILALINQLYIKDNISKQKTKRLFVENIKDKETIQLILLKENQTIGFASFKIMNNIQSQGKIAYLTELIIEENHRNKGFGTRLLSRIMLFAKQKKCIELQFSSTFKRKRAHDFYEKLGFSKTAYFFWKTL